MSVEMDVLLAVFLKSLFLKNKINTFNSIQPGGCTDHYVENCNCNCKIVFFPQMNYRISVDTNVTWHIFEMEVVFKCSRAILGNQHVMHKERNDQTLLRKRSQQESQCVVQIMNATLHFKTEFWEILLCERLGNRFCFSASFDHLPIFNLPHIIIWTGPVGWTWVCSEIVRWKMKQPNMLIHWLCLWIMCNPSIC